MTEEEPKAAAEVKRQYAACKFDRGPDRLYTYHFDGPPLAPGDMVKIADRFGDGWQRIMETHPLEAMEELRKCTEAEGVAWEMDRWRKGQPEEDVTTPKRATYTGHTSANSEDKARGERRAALVQALREAQYHTQNAIDMIAAGPMEGDDADSLLTLAEVRGSLQKVDVAASARRHAGE